MNWGEVATILWNSMFVVPFLVGVVVFETDTSKTKKIGCILLFFALNQRVIVFLSCDGVGCWDESRSF